MAEGVVVNLFEHLPALYVDDRITALHRRFGRESFSMEEGRDALGVGLLEATELLLYSPLSDQRWRVVPFSGKFRLLPVPPDSLAAIVWRKVLDHKQLPQPFSITDFASVTGVPYASAAYVTNVLVRHGYLTCNVVDASPLFRQNRMNRRRIVNLVPKRRVILRQETAP